MTLAATQRRPPARCCRPSSSGQVATTIMIAQISAPRNGRRIQKDAAISPPMNSTVSTERVRSLRGSFTTARCSPLHPATRHWTLVQARRPFGGAGGTGPLPDPAGTGDARGPQCRLRPLRARPDVPVPPDRPFRPAPPRGLCVVGGDAGADRADAGLDPAPGRPRGGRAGGTALVRRQAVHGAGVAARGRGGHLFPARRL